MNDTNDQYSVYAVLGYYFPNFSGEAIQAHQCYTKLSQWGFSIVVLTQYGLDCIGLPQKEKVDNITIRRLSILRPAPRWFSRSLVNKIFKLFSGMLVNFSFALSCSWVLFRDRSRIKTVFFHSFDEFTFLTVGLSRLLGLNPVIKMTLFGSDDPGSFMQKTFGPFKRIAFIMSKTIISISTPLTTSYLKENLDATKIVQIPNGVDLIKFAPISSSEKNILRARLGLNPESRYIIFVGAVIPRKGIDILVSAFFRLAAQIDDLHLLIVGPDDFTDRQRHQPETNQFVIDLHQQIDKAGLSNRVLWTGMVNNVNEYLQASDIFSFPSRREGFGIVIIEAMSVGLPVVVSSLDGISSDIIHSGHDGIIVQNEDPDEYARHLFYLLTDKPAALQMGEYARQRVQEAFTLDRVSLQYADLFRRLGDK